MSEWRRSGVDIVVSLLESKEAVDLDLRDEQPTSEASGIELRSFPIADRSVPESDANLHRLLRALDSKLSDGKNVVVHCRQGVGRAGLIAAALLVEKGLSPDRAIERVSGARGVQIPETEEQRLWIESFAATLVRKP